MLATPEMDGCAAARLRSPARPIWIVPVYNEQCSPAIRARSPPAPSRWGDRLRGTDAVQAAQHDLQAAPARAAVQALTRNIMIWPIASTLAGGIRRS